MGSGKRRRNPFIKPAAKAVPAAAEIPEERTEEFLTGGPADVAEAAAKPKRTRETGVCLIDRDPRVYAQSIRPPAPLHKRFLGIDLGTKCGVTFCDIVPGAPVTAAQLIMGMWDLSVGDYDTGPLRHVRLKEFLSIMSPDLIILEDVKTVPAGATILQQRGASANAIIAMAATSIEFMGGLKTTVTTWAEERGIPVQCVAIAQIKKYAAGKGNANKVDMINAANTQFGTNFDPATYESTGVDNIVDSAFICKMAIDSYSRGL